MTLIFSLFGDNSDGDWETFVDEVSGKALNSKLVAEAQAEELDYAARYNVWTLVPVSECWKETGAGPIGSRWININKGDEQRPNYRSIDPRDSTFWHRSNLCSNPTA